MSLLFWMIGLVWAGPVTSDGLVQAALERIKSQVTYDGSYFSLKYPGGDVPAHLGVCTDVVIRSYRALGVDLQKEVHEDMKKHFALYPTRWGMRRPDSNIDHRRVPNLQVFFSRKGKPLPVSSKRGDYLPGDLVTWDLGRGLTHIGVVVAPEGIVHNIGAGPRKEDVLFSWKITGHYRYFPH